MFRRKTAKDDELEEEVIEGEKVDDDNEDDEAPKRNRSRTLLVVVILSVCCLSMVGLGTQFDLIPGMGASVPAAPPPAEEGDANQPDDGSEAPTDGSEEGDANQPDDGSEAPTDGSDGSDEGDANQPDDGSEAPTDGSDEGDANQPDDGSNLPSEETDGTAPDDSSGTPPEEDGSSDFAPIEESNVCANNIAPIAQLNGPQESMMGKGLAMVPFDAINSSDSDGVIVAYEWAFGDGNNMEGSSVIHGYGNTGSYVVTLTVIDDCGAKTQGTLNVDIVDPVPPAE